MQKALIVEDDEKIAEHVAKLLQEEGWRTHVLDSALALSEALLGKKDQFSLIILDRLLGRVDTKDQLREIRSKWPDAQIMILSAINTPLERAELLNMGVDDYIGKPFLNQEFIARVRALTRRAKAPSEKYRTIGNTVLDLERYSIQVAGKEEALPQKEFALLKLLTKEPGRVLRRDDLLAVVWGDAASIESNVVEATLTHLRRRLEACGSSIKLKNLKNVGYFVET
ncbi:MAG: response regulator transcription factor [Bdellovibrionia bacterium]